MATAFLLDPFIQIQDNNGLTVPCAKIYVYLSNSTTLATTYSDFQGHLNTNPVITDALGHATVIADDSTAYDVEIRDSYGVLLMSQKNLTVGGSGGGSGDIPVEAGYGIEVVRTEGAYKVSVDTDIVATHDDLVDKQDRLSAGDNISIENNTVSVTGKKELQVQTPIKFTKTTSALRLYLDPDFVNTATTQLSAGTDLVIDDNVVKVNTTSTATGEYNFVSGDGSTVTGDRNLVGGLEHSIEGDDNIVAGTICTVVDGSSNNAVVGDELSVEGSSNALFGGSNTVLGDNNLVFGESNEINDGSDNLIGGASNFVGESYYNLVIGNGNDLSDGNNNIIAGNGNSVEKSGNIVGGIGNSVQASSYFNIVSGSDNSVSGSKNLLQVGCDNRITSSDCILVGGIEHQITHAHNVVVGGEVNRVEYADNSLVCGHANSFVTTTTFHGYNNLVGGNNNTIYASNSVVCGNNNFVGDALSYLAAPEAMTCVGLDCHIDGKCSAAFGENLIATSNYNFAVGKYNRGDNCLFSVGCGTDDNARADAFRVDGQGRCWAKDPAGSGLFQLKPLSSHISSYIGASDSPIVFGGSVFDNVGTMKDVISVTVDPHETIDIAINAMMQMERPSTSLTSGVTNGVISTWKVDSTDLHKETAYIRATAEDPIGVGNLHSRCVYTNNTSASVTLRAYLSNQFAVYQGTQILISSTPTIPNGVTCSYIKIAGA